MITQPPFTIDGRSGAALYGAWNVEAYEHAVQRTLAQVSATVSGQELIRSLRYPVRIIPFNFQNREHTCNAGANVHPPRTMFNVAAAMPHGVSPLGSGITGWGTGASSEIQYTPGFFVYGDPLHCGLMGPGTSVDEVLFHEIAHAATNSAGTNDPRPLAPPLNVFESVGEYDATILTNVFSSETHRALRGSYPEFRLLEDPIGFYARDGNAAMIDRICTSMPVLTYVIARVPCHFNPFREYYRERAGLAPSSARAVRPG